MSRSHRAWWCAGWLWIVAVFYLSLTPYPPEPVSFEYSDKFEHALAYAFLTLWFCQIQVARKQRRVVAASLVAMGIVIEYLQRMTGYRMFEYADMLADATGVLLGLGLAQTILGRVLRILENNGKH